MSENTPPPGRGWPSLPPSGGPTAKPAPKPGLIALAPMDAGSILEATINFVRRQPRTVFSAAAIVAVLAALANLAGLALYYEPLSDGLDQLGELTADPTTTELDTAALADAFGTLMSALTGFVAISAVATGLGLVFVTGTLTHVLGRDVLGDSTSLGEAWTLARGQMPSLAALMVIIWALLFAPLALLISGAWLLLDGGGAATTSAGLGSLLLLGGLFLGLAFLFAVYPRLIMAIPALLLERCSIGTALKRSSHLLRGMYARVVGIWLLGFVLVQVVASVVSVPFTALAGAFAVDSTELVSMSTGSLFMSSLATIVSTMITAPVMIAVMALLYLDVRMRKEGLAEQLVAQSQP